MIALVVPAMTPQVAAASPVDQQRARVESIVDELEKLEEQAIQIGEDYVTAIDRKDELDTEIVDLEGRPARDFALERADRQINLFEAITEHLNALKAQGQSPIITVNGGGAADRLAQVLVDHDLDAFVKRSDLSRDRDEQRPDRFAVGQKVDARVTQFDKKTRKLAVSIKALEIAEEKEAVAQYGSTDSGASLGDILGAALKKKGE